MLSYGQIHKNISYRIFISFSTSLRLMVSIRLTPCSFGVTSYASFVSACGENSLAPLLRLFKSDPLRWAPI